MRHAFLLNYSSPPSFDDAFFPDLSFSWIFRPVQVCLIGSCCWRDADESFLCVILVMRAYSLKYLPIARLFSVLLAYLASFGLVPEELIIVVEGSVRTPALG